ncbi:hypothetical protein CMK13_05585 [Candidatus Poribacteria bacterium]|nr:hypothetical protein [Candidatus Poribacteria bacterium]|tara:strand:- start:730 stop:1128 length:399 start_codon:yes stop_codon:yes gene_type:complete
MSILKKIFSTGAKELVESVGEVIDELHTSEEEKEQTYNELKKMIEEYDYKMQQEVTKRWESDNLQSSWLPRNIRPLSLAFLLIVLTVFTLIDFKYVNLSIKDTWIDLWQILSITAFGAYFGSRGLEKINKKK